MRVSWLHTPLRNLNDEAEYIALDDPRAAQLVVAPASMLAEQTGLGHPGACRVRGS